MGFQVAVCAGLFLSLTTLTFAQYMPDTPNYEEEYATQQALLEEEEKSLPSLEPHFYPERSQIDINIYTFTEPTEYSIGLLIDPCLNKDSDCCNGIYGTPEYRAVAVSGKDPVEYAVADGAPISHTTKLVDEFGVEFALLNSRWVDDEIILDEECVDIGNPHEYCMGFRQRHQQSSSVPVCWDNNSTVIASQCRDIKTGVPIPRCMEVGYTQTAYIIICGGKWKESDHCGTFLEVHRPGGSPYDDEETILAETRLTVQKVSGYETTQVSTSYKGDPNKVLCHYEDAEDGLKGNYEIWWVKRTKYNFIIEKKKRFRVVNPPCSYDTVNDRFFPFAWYDEVEGAIAG